MAKYPLEPLTNLCDVLSGGTPRTNVAEYWDGEVPWASVKDFNHNSRWFSSTEKSITSQGLHNCSSVLLEPGEIIISARGTVGVVAQSKVHTAFNQSNYGIRAKRGLADNDYIYYALVNSRQALLGDSHGGMFDTITRSTLDRLLIPCPPLRDQERIARALGYFDEKIALNLDVAENLESIAKTIFKSWFIDFDPVHAKARGEQPEGMDVDTAALFPDSFKDASFLNEHKGFRKVRFDSFAQVQLGGTPSKKREEYWDGEIPWINSGSVNDFRITKPSAMISEIGLKNSSCKLLPAGTLVLAITGATLGQFSRVEIDTTANQSVIGIVPHENTLNNFLYLWMSFHISELTAKATGGAQQHINRNDVCEHEILIPGQQLLRKFDEIVAPLFSAIAGRVFENETLQTLRDSLLPRLISGELEIPEELLVD